MSVKLILGSSSPFRRQLLERLQIPFEVVSPEVDETPLDGESPQALVERLAVDKAHAAGTGFTDSLVIGSDQVAVHGGKIVGKPGSHDNAVRQLQAASGTRITLYTGLALLNTASGGVQREVVPYSVVFRSLSDDLIERYLRKEQPYNCAGSIRSEGLGIALLEKFEGDDPNTLIGLPLIRLVRMLENEGIPVI